MIQKLCRHGDDLALVFNREVLASFGIDEETPLQVSVVGTSVTLAPKRADERSEESACMDRVVDRRTRFERAMASTIARYENTLRRLAE